MKDSAFFGRNGVAIQNNGNNNNGRNHDNYFLAQDTKGCPFLFNFLLLGVISVTI